MPSAQLTVLRADLIKAIEAKAALAQTKYDASVAEAEKNDLGRIIDKAIAKAKEEGERNFGIGTAYLGNGTTLLSVAEAAKKDLLSKLGLTTKGNIAKPYLFERELTLLKLAQDEKLTLDSNDPLLVAASQ